VIVLIKVILTYLNKIKNLFVIIPIVIALMLIVGLFFANQKSKPEFASKPEKVMFDVKNKSPKYVMTLPEKSRKVADVDTETKQDLNQKKYKTNNEKLNELDIPFLSRLDEISVRSPQQYILPYEGILEKGTKMPIKTGTLKAWDIYGRKINVMPMFSKVAVVIKGMGKNNINADLIIHRMPENVSLSFSPYAFEVEDLIKLARENGFETYLDIVLPSRNYLLEDSGQFALDFSNDIAENVNILNNMLAMNVAVGGFVLQDGIDDDEYNDQFIAIMEMLKKRGLLLLDATHKENISVTNVNGLDRVRADIIIDKDFDKSLIEKQLQKAEQIAYRNGSVVIVIEPKPVVVLAVADWLNTFSQQLSYEEMKAQNVSTFEKPLILVPLSNLAVEY